MNRDLLLLLLDEMATYIKHQIDPSYCDGIDCYADEPERLLEEYDRLMECTWEDNNEEM